MPTPERLDLASLRRLLHAGWIGTPGTRLREEDEKKALELERFLAEALSLLGKGDTSVVDAAAGKGYVGLFLALANPTVASTLIERDPRRCLLATSARDALGVAADRAAILTADVADATAWPAAPALVVSLHACGDATDRTLAAAIASDAKRLFVAPCCVASSLPAARRAARRAEALGFAHLTEAKRHFVESVVLAERALTLEAAGYRVETMAFVGPRVTPYNIAIRAVRAHEPQKRARAEAALAALRAEPEAGRPH